MPPLSFDETKVEEEPDEDYQCERAYQIPGNRVRDDAGAAFEVSPCVDGTNQPDQDENHWAKRDRGDDQDGKSRGIVPQPKTGEGDYHPDDRIQPSLSGFGD